jgi:large subunit ribosomal protein L5
MHFLEKFYNKTLKQELLNKYIFNSTQSMPKLKKIILNFGCKTADFKHLSSSLLAFELITSQKGFITRTKYPNLLLKIRKGNPTGCKIVLSKRKYYAFFSIIVTEILPKLKNFEGFNSNAQISKNAFSLDLKEIFLFKELENRYYLFNTLSKLNITIITNTDHHDKLRSLLKSLQLPLHN